MARTFSILTQSTFSSPVVKPRILVLVGSISRLRKMAAPVKSISPLDLLQQMFNDVVSAYVGRLLSPRPARPMLKLTNVDTAAVGANRQGIESCQQGWQREHRSLESSGQCQDRPIS